MGVIYTILPISGILIFLYGVLNIIGLWNGAGQEQREAEEMP